MTPVFAVALREIRQRRLVLAAAAVVAVLPFLLPLTTRLPRSVWPDVREACAVIAAMVLIATLSIGLSGSMFVSATSTAALSFDLCRPIRGWSLWLGKMTGAMGLVVGSAAVVVIPSWLVSGVPSTMAETPVWTLLVAVGAALPMMPALHVVTVVVRHRSLLMFVEVLLIVGAVLILWSVVDGFIGLIASGPLAVALVSMVVITAIGLLGASATALVRGRCEPGRAHRSAAVVLWPIVGLSLCTAAGMQWWVAAGGPQDMGTVTTYSTWANGNWVDVQGLSRGSMTRFLVDLDSGRYTRITSLDAHVLIARDAPVAVWYERDPRWARTHEEREVIAGLRVDDLSDDQPPRVYPGIRLLEIGGGQREALSPKGTYLATLDGGVLTVFELSSGDPVLREAILRSGASVIAMFVDDETLQFYAYSPRASDTNRIEIWNAHVPTREVISTGAIDIAGELRHWNPITVDSKGERLVVLTGSDEAVTMYDARDGHEIAVLRDDPSVQGRRICFLADGRIALSRRDQGRDWVDIFTNQGARIDAIELPAGVMPWIEAEVSPGVLSVFGVVDQRAWEDFRMYLLDIDLREVRFVGEALCATRFFYYWSIEDPGSIPDTGSPVLRLFQVPVGPDDGERGWYETPSGYTRRTAVVSLDPDTLELTPVFGRP